MHLHVHIIDFVLFTSITSIYCYAYDETAFVYFDIYISAIVYYISRYPTIILEMIDHITKFDGLLERAIQDDDMVCIFDVFSFYSLH